MKTVLISPYEIGRQPFALAHASAYLSQAGFEVICIDLSLDKLDEAHFHNTKVVFIHLAMHTATRMAVELLPKLKKLAPSACLCVYGLYAPLNAELFYKLGVDAVFGGETEPDLVQFAHSAEKGARDVNNSKLPKVSLDKIKFLKPQRDHLPSLEKYAHLITAQGQRINVGFAEASRGCKHLCRHCPVVPVYQGKFRIVQVDIVLKYIQQQIATGAEHISFGDPDFLNGPTHALRVVNALHDNFPSVSYDITVKIQHIVQHANLLKSFADTGCKFITSAVESLDANTLNNLDKQHTVEDFHSALALLEKAGINLAPTFVPFTPWTTLEDYAELLRSLVTLDLVANVPPIQLAIRLLIPRGSYLMQLPEVIALVDEFEDNILGYPWKHTDAAVDKLQRQVQALVEQATDKDESRWGIFSKIWALTHRTLNRSIEPLPTTCKKVPDVQLSEVWYCCAEPTSQQLSSI